MRAPASCCRSSGRGDRCRGPCPLRRSRHRRARRERERGWARSRRGRCSRRPGPARRSGSAARPGRRRRHRRSTTDAGAPQTRGAVPGQGRTKKLYGSRDFAFATGTISYSLKKYFNFQFGHDKNFIGDGYRSILLSDYAFNYPFLKINVDVWKIKYTFMLAAFQDILIGPPPNYDPEDFSFRKKWGSFHYFDFNIGKRMSVGILEGVIWKSDSVRAKAIDINYFNPFIFFRPVEFSMSSPDNAMLGLNLKFKISSTVTTYGQVMLDDFKIEQVRAGTGWYGNKQAIQWGIKGFNLLRINNLSALTEINYVRPFTYSHRSSLSNYCHYNEPLAHALRSDFIESVTIIKYTYRNFYSRLQFMYYVAGADTGGYNYGNNILLPYSTKANEYGNFVPNGLKNTVKYAELNVGYLFNPHNNLKVEFGIVSRKQNSLLGNCNSLYFTFGIKTSLLNKNYDL